jgi:hypothetical protein
MLPMISDAFTGIGIAVLLAVKVDQHFKLFCQHADAHCTLCLSRWLHKHESNTVLLLTQ